MTDGQAVVIGATISGTIGVLVVLVQQWIAHKREDRNARAQRLAEFSAAGWVLTLCTGDLARASVADKLRVEAENADAGYRFTNALTQIQLLDTAPVYEAAQDVDRELTRLISAAKRKVHTREEWRDARAGLTVAVLAFQRAARRALRSEDIQLRLPSGDEPELG